MWGSVLGQLVGPIVRKHQFAPKRRPPTKLDRLSTGAQRPSRASARLVGNKLRIRRQAISRIRVPAGGVGLWRLHLDIGYCDSGSRTFGPGHESSMTTTAQLLTSAMMCAAPTSIRFCRYNFAKAAAVVCNGCSWASTRTCEDGLLIGDHFESSYAQCG